MRNENEAAGLPSSSWVTQEQSPGREGKTILVGERRKKSDNVIIILLRRTPACPASCERKPKSVEMVWPIWDILAAAVASLVPPCEDVLESS